MSDVRWSEVFSMWHWCCHCQISCVAWQIDFKESM